MLFYQRENLVLYANPCQSGNAEAIFASNLYFFFNFPQHYFSAQYNIVLFSPVHNIAV